MLSYGNNGDQAGSDALPGVFIFCKLRPDKSIDQIELDPYRPLVSLEKTITRPFGDQVGPSSIKLSVRILSSLPSGFMTPMENLPFKLLTNAILSPRGDHTGDEYLPSP
jgi:hypothetical protein